MAPLGSAGPLENIVVRVALTQSSLLLVAVVGNKVKQEKKTRRKLVGDRQAVS